MCRRIIVSGRLGANAEKKITSTGKEYITLRLANNEYGDEKNADGTYARTYWFQVISYNTAHFALLPHLTKGSLIQVIGPFDDKVYQNQAGNCEVGRSIRCESIEFIGQSNGNKQPNGSVSTSARPTTSSIPTVSSTPTPTVAAPVNAVADDDDDLPF